MALVKQVRFEEVVVDHVEELPESNEKELYTEDLHVSFMTLQWHL